MPALARQHYLKAKEYSYSKQHENTIKECNESIKIKPTAEAYCEMAVSYMEKKDFNAAIGYLKESIKINPKYPKPQYAIAVCYISINPADTKSARMHYEKAKKLKYQIPEWFIRRLKKLEGASK